MKRILVSLTKKQLEEFDNLVKNGIYASRSEAVRDAVRLLIEKKKLKDMQEKME